jgi:hypothetical protein
MSVENPEEEGSPGKPEVNKSIMMKWIFIMHGFNRQRRAFS